MTKLAKEETLSFEQNQQRMSDILQAALETTRDSFISSLSSYDDRYNQLAATLDATR